MAYPDPPTTPPVPQRGDRATFSGRVDAFLTWVAAIIPWLQGYIADFMATLTTLAAGGANSFSYRFSTDTAVADPGPGFLRLNSATQNSASRLIIDPLDRNAVDISSVLNQITASTSSIKGSVRLQKLNDPTAWMLFDITGFTAATGFYNLTLALRAASSASPFSANDSIVVFTERNGDRGDNAGANNYAKFSERKAPNNNGGTNVSGYQDRVLNTVDTNDIPGAGISLNTITLPAGTYQVEASAPAYGIGVNRAYLYNISDGINQIIGSAETALGSSSAINQTRSVLSGKFTITSPKQFKLRHFTANPRNDTGLGVGIAATINVVVGGSTTEPEIFSEIIILKVA